MMLAHVITFTHAVADRIRHFGAQVSDYLDFAFKLQGQQFFCRKFLWLIKQQPSIELEEVFFAAWNVIPAALRISARLSCATSLLLRSCNDRQKICTRLRANDHKEFVPFGTIAELESIPMQDAARSYG